MFYSVIVLGKKGPLARVWLAAHWDKKITKAQILETNIVESVDSILQPRVKLSLRTSSHLLLGIVRIYARKTLYLLQDCQDAAFKIKSAFRPGAVDLPDSKNEAAISAITLPEVLDFIDDFEMLDAPVTVEPAQTNANLRSITLPDEVGNMNMDDPLMEAGRDWDLSSVHGDGMTNGGKGHGSGSLDMFDRPPLDDGFGGPLGVGLEEEEMFPMQMPSHTDSQADNDGIIPPTPAAQEANGENGGTGRPDSRMSDRSSYMSFGGGSPAPSGPPSTPGSVAGDGEDMDVDGNAETANANSAPNRRELPDSMVLEPLGEGAASSLAPRRKRRKKLGIIIDEVKTLSGEEMKSQLSDTTDIVSKLDLAPPSKKYMHWKKTSGAEKLFSLSERSIPSRVIDVYYSRHLVTNRITQLTEEDSVSLASEDLYSEQNAAKDKSLVNSRVNGDLSKHPELEDITQNIIAPLTPGREDYLREPRTPKTPNYRELGGGIHRSPSKKRRRTERDADKENRKQSSNHVNSGRHSSLGEDASVARAGSQVFGNDDASVLYNRNSAMFEPDSGDDTDEFDRDYAQPMSVGPNEDQLPEETAEQFEERVQNKRTNVLLKFMGNTLEEEGHVSFSHLVKQNRRKQVAQKFFSLLVLKKQHAIELTQNSDTPYSEIFITKGVRFDECLASSSL